MHVKCAGIVELVVNGAVKRGFVCCAMLGLTLTGCSEYRISIDDFLARQNAQAQATIEPPSAAEVGAVDQQLGRYRLGSGDVINITLSGTGDPSLLPPVQARVDNGGKVDLPIAGLVDVAGLDLVDAEDAIKRAYVPSIAQQAAVHVELISADPTSVLVVGAVTSPGLIPLRRTERDLLHAIVGAGGVTEVASGTATLRRIRFPRESATFNLIDPNDLRQALAAAPLANGDIIEVHAAKPNTVFVGGLVNIAAPQDYPPGTRVSVLQALAAAGGLRTDVYPKEGTLIRRTPGGEDLHVKLELDRIAKGQAPNIMLASGDILWVPHTLETRIQEFVNRNIFLRAGVTVTYNITGREFMNRPRQQTTGFSGGTLEDAFDPFGFLAPVQ